MRYRSLVLLLVLILLIAIIPLPTTAATTGELDQTTWGGSNYDYAQAVTVDSSGNRYIVGYTWSFTPGTPSIFLLKFNFTGGLLMQRLWTDGAFDYAYGVALDSGGNIYVAGWTNNFGGPALLLLKFTPSGTLSWQETWGGSSHPAYGQGVAVDSIGNIYVTGYYASSSGSDQNVSLVKFDPLGNLLWQRSWGGTKPDQGRSVAVDSSGNLYVAGSTSSSSSGGSDALLLKFTSGGMLLNQTIWGGANDDQANGVTVDSSGRVFVTGSTLSAGLVSEAFLLKFSSAGKLLTASTYALAGDTIGHGVAVNSTSGEIWVAGSTVVGAYTKGLILRFASGGGLISQTQWGGTLGSDAAYAVADDISGNVVMAGYVSEAPPYKYTNLTGTLSSSNLPSSKPALAVIDPGLTFGFASGVPSTPPGSTSYSGGPDVFVSKFGMLPRIQFSASPDSGGSINFAGVAYSNGAFGDFVYGSYLANAAAANGFNFSSWTTSGGVSVQSLSSNPVMVTVTGPGTLTALFRVTIVNITFQIPNDRGTVTCQNKTYLDGQSARFSVGATVNCKANPYAGFVFASWSGLSSASTNPISFQVTRGGVLTSSFNALPPSSFSPFSLLFSAPLIVVVPVLRKHKQK